MRVIFVSCLLFLSVLFASALVSAAVAPPEPPPPPVTNGEDDYQGKSPSTWETPKLPTIFVTERQLDRTITQIENRGFFQAAINWVREVINYFFGGEGNLLDVKSLCGSNPDAANTVSTASAEDRNRAANAVIQNTYQGLGGYGRPFSARVRVTFADGGTEWYKFNGASSFVITIEDSLTTGSGVSTGCPA